MDPGKTQMIAIVDDDESVRDALRTLLKSYGLQARTFASAEEFLESGQQSKTACLITDVRMCGMSGLELQSRLAQDNCTLPIIFISAHGDHRTRWQAMRSGAIQFLEKPFNNDVLIASVHSVLGG